MSKKTTTAILDIGSSKIVCLIADVDSGGVVVKGIGHQISQGIRAGIIIDVKQAESAILAAVHAAEKMAGETIDRVVVGMSGGGVASHYVEVNTSVSGQEVTDRDIRHILAEGYSRFEKDESAILHCIPIYYTLDDTDGITDPRGMVGNVLKTYLHIVTASTTAMRNMANCLRHCHLEMQDEVNAAYASGLACLTEDEKKLGTILLDIGEGNTAISVFHEGKMVFSSSIAVGGGHITRDVARGLSTTLGHAERIKVLYGNVVSTAMDGQDIIDIPLSELVTDDTTSSPDQLELAEDGYISRSLLTSIIKPRVEEILELVMKRLKEEGVLEVCGPRVVITGGGAQLQGLRELAGHMLNKHIRIGRPRHLEGMADATSGAAFSAAIGMLIYLKQKESLSVGSIAESESMARQGGVGRVMRWFKDNF